jgi:competence protein ComEC
MFYAVIAISFTVTLKWAWILRLLGICGILFSLQLDEEKNPNDLEITMLDMGQAECIHIRYPMGKNGLIDAGSPAFPSYLTPISERVISRYLWDQRVRKLEFILLTHPETDHMSAFTFLSNVFQPNSVLFSRYHPAYGNALETLKAGETFWIGGVRHWIPHPDSTRAEKLKVNDSSVVVEIRYGRFSALFTGDITVEIERKLVDKLRPVILLKVPHHGSDSSSSKFLLDTIRPKMAWISAGRRNPFGHPHLNVLKRLSERGTQILTTPEQGSLRLRTDGIHLRVQHYQSVTGGFIDLFQEKLPLMD